MDTIMLDNNSWLEYAWLEPMSAEDTIAIDKKKTQVIFPFTNRITRCKGKSEEFCRFEIYDNNWNTAGFKGDFFYYKPKDAPIPESLELWVEEKKTKVRVLILSRSSN